MLHIHRAERADGLIGGLAELLAVPPEDPLEPELIAVHSRGIERWLAQELSTRLGTGEGRRDGVCSNVDFPFPSRVVGRALAAAGGIDPDADPWSPQRLVWPLLDVVQAHLDQPWLAPLASHLGVSSGTAEPARRNRRFGAVRHLADLFDRYAVHRPDMLRAWAAGRDVDGSGATLGDAAWQAELWRLVRERLDVASPVERLDDAVERLRAGLVVPDLPGRLALFALTALPVSYVQVLAALAATRDVHLFLLHPSPRLWQRVGARLDAAPRSRVPRATDPTRELPRHPLLASWGRDAREMQLVVAAAGNGAVDHHQALDVGEPSTLLTRLQADVRADQASTGLPGPGERDTRPVLARQDRSLQVHACHGRTRQVEVMRDAILHLLADDPSLQPRDVVVMCPDVETFAPIVHAVFVADAAQPRAGSDDGGRGPGRRMPDLRVRLADRSIRQTNPLLRVVAELLDIADGRLAASEVLDLAAREPVRRRFGFDDADLSQIESWVADAGVRWGLDASHRAAFGLDGLAANTWGAGLDRLLLGVAMADEDDRLFGGAVPLDDVEGDAVDAAGRLAELVGRLDAALARLRGPHAVQGWRTAIVEAVDILTATPERFRWQGIQLDRLLDDVVEEATLDGGPSPVELTLAEVRSLLDDRLQGRPTRANHRTGDLTVCTLVPMRSVPHRVVCLLGMDDGTFPRRTAGDGDDLVERDPYVGDRDPRTEDRQLLLDALLAAGDHLVVTHTGYDERTNEPRPPAVPVGELLDVLDRTVRTDGDGRSARHHVVVEHPLQAFDARNFRPGALVCGRPWGFEPAALAGARTLTRGRTDPPPFLAEPLPPEDSDTVDLGELVRFLQHPAKTFLRRRLGVTLPDREDEPADAMPAELGPLEDWVVGDRLLHARVSHADTERWAAAERARGVLPPGALAQPVLDKAGATVDAVVQAAREETGAPFGPDLDIDIGLGDGRRLRGLVSHVAGDALLAVQYSRVGAKHRLAAWVRLLAATAAHPERPLSAVTVGRCRDSGSKTKTVTVARIGPLAPTPQQRRAVATTQLQRVVDLYDRGLRAPVPLYCKTSAAYAAATRDGKDPHAAARGEWTTTWKYDREDRDAGHTLVLGGVVPYDELLVDALRSDAGEGWTGDERTRLGRYACRLWDELLSRETVEDR
ncbi:MAG: exodeoxyribonuclease V subunit gamma [Actinobacteria bacterium]|nr:exodeoxyribonuclease V subunit gamma [Actinomycetota bacterium]